MKVLMIIIITYLSHSKSQEFSALSSDSEYDASSISGKLFESTELTTVTETFNASTYSQSPQKVDEQSTETSQAVKDTVNSLSKFGYWKFTKSKLQCAWYKVKQISSCTAKTTRKAMSYIGNKVKQLIDYMNQGHEIVESLQDAVKSAGEVTKNSENQSVQIINSFITLLKHILKILKKLLITDPIEIARERESLAE